MEFRELLLDIVTKNKRDDFSLLEDDYKKELAIAWLEFPADKYEAAAMLLDAIALSAQDWIGHFIKGEPKEMAGVILNRFVNLISDCKCLNSYLTDAYVELFGDPFEDPAPRRGGRIDEVL